MSIATVTENGFKQGLLGSDELVSYMLSTQIKPLAWHCAVFCSVLVLLKIFSTLN